MTGLGCSTPGLAQTLAPVPLADLALYRVSDFSGDELDLPYYLAHFHQVANSVMDTGENRGFMNLSVWRGQKNLKPYNARIMENCLSLAYFYCTPRSWNPYYQDPALRLRLEAALDFWCRSQSENGSFSEYAPKQWSLAPTAFATKFMGETLRLLEQGPAIDPVLLERVWQAQRRAIWIVLTDGDFWLHGRSYTNQFSNVWAGALAYLAIRPDSELEMLLRTRIRDSVTAFQSPAGYFYERDGPDWGYNLGTHHSNLHVAWHYARGTDLEPVFLGKAQRWYDWLSYNAVMEPDGSGFTLNRAIETRQRRGFIEAAPDEGAHNYSSTPYAEKLERVRAFMMSEEELAGLHETQRNTLAEHWPRVPALEPGMFGTFSPYAFLHRDLVRWRPTAAQKTAAQAQLPYLAFHRFTHQRVDSRRAVNFTYIRRPAYYAAFNAGVIINAQQRYGLGLLWHERAGTVLQSQSGSSDAAWGTKALGNDLVYEARDLPARFVCNGRDLDIAPGNHTLPDADVLISYPLGTNGDKQVSFDDTGIRVEISHPGAFVETLPLLTTEDDVISLSDGNLTLRRGSTLMQVAFEPAVKPVSTTTTIQIGVRRLQLITVTAQDRLGYRITFETTPSQELAAAAIKSNSSGTDITYGENATHMVRIAPGELGVGQYNVSDLKIQPSYGLWARHVRGLTLDNCTFDYETRDSRYAILLQDVADARISAVTMVRAGDNDEAIKLLNSPTMFIENTVAYDDLWGNAPGNLAGQN